MRGAEREREKHRESTDERGEMPADQALKRPGGVNVIRYGVPARQLTSQK